MMYGHIKRTHANIVRVKYRGTNLLRVWSGGLHFLDIRNMIGFCTFLILEIWYCSLNELPQSIGPVLMVLLSNFYRPIAMYYILPTFVSFRYDYWSVLLFVCLFLVLVFLHILFWTFWFFSILLPLIWTILPTFCFHMTLVIIGSVFVRIENIVLPFFEYQIFCHILHSQIWRMAYVVFFFVYTICAYPIMHLDWRPVYG